MSPDDAHTLLQGVITTVAPEIDVHSVQPETLFLDDLQLDSMDFLNLVIGVYEQTGVEIPERDYDAILRYGDFVDYLIAQR